MSLDISISAQQALGAQSALGSQPALGAPSARASTAWVARILALAGLAALAASLTYAAHVARQVLTDAWVAPLHLSPDNEHVLDLRLRRTKERADRGRLVAEVSSFDEEIHGADTALERLRLLVADYRGGLAWSRRAQGVEVQELTEQGRRLESERDLLRSLLGDQQKALERAKSNASAGLVPEVDVERESIALRQLRVGIENCELDLGRARAALSVATRADAALSGASSHPEAPHRQVSTSPDVVKFYDDQVRIELEIDRLEGEKRTAGARKAAALDALAEMDDLLHELESRPLYRAMAKDTDLAFAPYEHLKRVTVGDRVYACSFSVFACHVTGTVAEIVPGEVITQDPWGEMARGQYLVLTTVDRSALYERVLRVRHDDGFAVGTPAPAPSNSLPESASR
jgi:hypothetical protein